MTTTTTLTAADKYNAFVAEYGSDVASMTSENASKFQKLLGAKIREENPKEEKVRENKKNSDTESYKEICEKHGIAISEKFEGWEVTKKPGQKDKTTGETPIAQYIVGLKYKLAGEDASSKRLRKILSNVSPKEYSEEVEIAEKVLAAKALAAI